MSEQALQSSFEEFVANRAIPPDMLQDLLAIASLDSRVAEDIAESLGGLEGLNSADAIRSTIADCLEGRHSDQLANSVLNGLLAINSKTLGRYMAFLSEWISGHDSRRKVFSKETLERLEINLRTMLKGDRAVKLMRKADALLRDVGNEVDSFKFVCDLRPVFDESREYVEALVLIANLRIIYLSQDGQRRTCELALVEDELKALRDDAQKAIDKLEILKKLKANASVGNPDGGTANG